MKRFLALFLSCLLLVNTTVAGIVFAQDLKVEYYHTDNFGTPVAMTDTGGKVIWRADELPFGKEYKKQEIATKNDHRYLGKELDRETGLICMGARYLDPATGRFNRPDPVQLIDPFTGKINQQMLLNPQRQNRYIYGLNNPYRFVDPDGNCAVRLLILAESAYVKAAPYVNRAASATGKYAQRGYRAVRGLFTNPAPKAISKLPVVRSAQGKLAGLGEKFSMTPKGILKHAQNSGTQYVDKANSSNINVLASRPDGKAGYLRVTLDPTRSRVISAGLNKARDVKSALKRGRLVKAD
jgi:RHS repeat-associated protein